MKWKEAAASSVILWKKSNNGNDNNVKDVVWDFHGGEKSLVAINSLS